MGSIINGVGIVGVPQILMFKGSLLQALYHIQRCDPTPKQLMTKVNVICTSNKVWEQKGEHFPKCFGNAFTLIQFQSKNALIIFFLFP